MRKVVHIRMSPKYFAAIASIFKNESHILKEWILTHIREGVDHFIMIDNGSTDSPTTMLQEYIDQGIVTYIYDATPHAQSQLYSKYILPRKEDAEWWMIIDLDEFVYGTQGTAADFLRTLEEDVGNVTLPWFVFGSNGFDEQPPGVVKYFTKREDLDGRITWLTNTKCIVRGKALSYCSVHNHGIEGQYRSVDGCHRPADNAAAAFTSEEYFRTTAIRLNHYKVQSWQLWSTVKMTRGDACGPYNPRDKEHFDWVNGVSNAVDDLCLYKKYQDLYDNLDN